MADKCPKSQKKVLKTMVMEGGGLQKKENVKLFYDSVLYRIFTKLILSTLNITFLLMDH